MNVIHGINLAGIVGVLGVSWKSSSDLQYDVKQLSERVPWHLRLAWGQIQIAAITLKK